MADTATAAPDPSRYKNQSLIDELNAALATGGGDERKRILERVADLFAAGSRGYSSQQIALFDDVLQKLCSDIEVKARARLARRLAHIDNAPPQLIRSLAFDDAIAVAQSVLIHAQQLSDADLVENATTKSQDHLFAIAQRLRLSERVTDVLVERGNRKVIHKVAANTGARFSLAGYDKLSHRARRDRKLTLALARRRDLPRQYFLKLLETASASVRAKLEAANPEAGAAIRDTVDEVDRPAAGSAQDVAALCQCATRRQPLFNAQPFTEANVHAPAHAQEFTRTVIALAKLGRFPVDLVERALIDKGEDMILILGKAAGCSWITVKELLLMYVAERNPQPDELTRTFDRYTKLTQEAARQIVDFYGQRVKVRGKEARNNEIATSA
jgi:uncharacterized protein (DUF2336 family)